MLELLKRRACELSFELFRENIASSRKIGLGSGSTVKYFIDLLFSSKLHADKEMYASSIDTQRYILSKHGVLVRTALDLKDRLDLYVDGFDEASANLDLVKGRGGAFYWEKILAVGSDLRVYVGDYTKWSGKPYLHLRPIPLEVSRGASFHVIRELSERGLRARIRANKSGGGPAVTDSGNYIIDVYISRVDDPARIDRWLKEVNGVLETGIFPSDLVDYVVVSGPLGNAYKVYAKS